MIRIDGLVDQI